MRRNKVIRWVMFILAMLLIVVAVVATAGFSIIPKEKVYVAKYEKWSPELVEEFGSLPIQDGGRVKPFSSWAGFELLSINGKRSVRFKNGRTNEGGEVEVFVDGKWVAESEANPSESLKIGPTEWALDCLFRPEVTEPMEFFQVENEAVIDMLKIDHSRKKARDRYSFNDIQPHLAEMDRIRGELREKKQKGQELDTVEQQFEGLAENLRKYIALRSHFAPVRTRLTPKGEEGVIGGADYSLMSTWMKQWASLREVLMNNSDPTTQRLLNDVARRLQQSELSDLAMMPPSDSEDKKWLVRGRWLTDYLSGQKAYDEDQMAYLEAMEKMAVAYDEEGERGLLNAVRAYKKELAPVLEKRDEGQSISSEIFYYKMDYFYRAFVGLIFGFLCVAVGWVAPGTKFSKVCNALGWVLLVFGILVTSAGITHRSILMDRPPVGNLYDTIPFIVAVSMIVLAVIELLTKRSVGLGVALFLGIIGLALAQMYEAGEGRDHMDPLVAVLRSNYWLTIHVLTITIGYAGGLLTAGLAHVYLFARWFGIDEGDKKFRRMMTRIVYGGVCFTLFFSLVGTVLGGVWANDSWGRFWGWDPKENGALIIVLWNLMILHARLGGYLREWGLHITAVLGAAWVAFSWWHVNFLGTGLHSYGFTGSKGVIAVWVFYGIELFVALVAVGCALYEKDRRRLKKLQRETAAVPMD